MAVDTTHADLEGVGHAAERFNATDKADLMGMLADGIPLAEVMAIVAEQAHFHAKRSEGLQAIHVELMARGLSQTPVVL